MNTSSRPARCPFRGFDERAPLQTYQGASLPHWRQDDATYFVTFRLADSLPHAVGEVWRAEKERAFRERGLASWEEARRRLPDRDFRSLERGLRRSLEAKLDAGYGACLMRDPAAAQIVAKALRHFHGERVWTGDFVVMPNHVHVLLRPFPGYRLEDLLRSIKGFSAWAIHRSRQGTGRGNLWQEESYDHLVRDAESLDRIRTYIGQNPERAGFPSGSVFVSTAEYEIE